MNKSQIIFIAAVVVMAGIYFARKKVENDNKTKPRQETRTKPPVEPEGPVKSNDPKDPNPETPSPEDNNNREDGLNRRVSNLIYTKHARCRMDCRHIDQSEVKEILRDGEINYRKSDLENTRGPKYAVEGTTHDNQRVRIVFAQDREGTSVVTVIDLDSEWDCDCK